jgi:hypothetical protein
VRGITSASAFIAASLSTVAVAEDASASFVTRLFMNVCIPNVGRPESVRAWVLEKKLAEVPAGAAFDVFVGPGNGGAAWAVPKSFGSFALSIRGKTHACAVYARMADPMDVENYFRKILEGVARPGLTVTIVKDAKDPSPSGTIHSLIYSVSVEGMADRGELFTMQTAEKSGGPFQATLQAAIFAEPP